MTTSVRQLYWLTILFAVVGFVFSISLEGARNGFGFLIGALGSFCNLWVFDWLSKSIAPGERQQKPWQASLFIGRYIVLVAAGYATVKALDVSPLAVLLGLLASSAAAITSAILDLIHSLLGKRSQ